MKPTDSSKLLEKDIEKRVCDYGKRTHNIEHRKFTSPARRSVPDQLMLPGDSVCFFIEFKRKGKKATDAQLREHRRLEAQGYTVYVIDDVDEGKGILDAWAAGAR